MVYITSVVEWVLAGALGLSWGVALPRHAVEQREVWLARCKLATWFLGTSAVVCGVLAVAWLKTAGGEVGGPTCFATALSPRDPMVCVPRHVSLLWLGSTLCLILHALLARLVLGCRLGEPFRADRFVWATLVLLLSLVLGIGWVYQPGGIGLVADRAGPSYTGLYGCGVSLSGWLALALGIGIGLVSRWSPADRTTVTTK